MVVIIFGLLVNSVFFVTSFDEFFFANFVHFGGVRRSDDQNSLWLFHWMDYDFLYALDFTDIRQVLLNLLFRKMHFALIFIPLLGTLPHLLLHFLRFL